MKKGFVPTCFGAAAISLLHLGALTADADTIQVVSKFDSSYAPSSTAGGNSGAAVFSPDGRYVAFASTAKNLALTSNYTAFAAQFLPCFNVFLRDRTNGTTTLVSVNAAGTGGGNADSIPTGISTNGQFVLFESFASNLVTKLTTGKGDVYLRDVVNGQTLLVSVHTSRAGANAVSRDSVLTPDGRYVAFSSLASDLVPNDTNGIFDVFIRDTVGATTELVSVGATGSTNSGVASVSRIPSVTPDGRYVLFYSTATNLLPGVPAVGELFLRDTLSNTTAWVSAGAQGLFQNSPASNFNSVSFNAALSDDGNYVAYEACSPGFPSPAYGFILRYNRQTGLTDIVNTNAYVQPLFLRENEASLDMTPDGRFIAYVGNTGQISGVPELNFTNAVFLWDAESGSNTLVSVNLTNGVTPGAESDLPAISTNGQYVTFVSSDTNLTTNVLSGAFHLYRRDMLAGVTQLVDTDTNGAGAGVTPDTAAVMSADGSLVAYQSDSGNITTNDRNRAFDLFISDFTNQRTELISARDPALPSVTPDGSSGISVFSVSPNGRFVAFASEADDIAAGDTNGLWDVFVRDLLNGTNALVSVAPNGFSANGASFEPSISGDGRYVAFSSYASNLVAGDTNASQDVFVRDLQAGVTTLVSVGLDGVSFGSSNSWQPTISADGRYVLFHSLAQNLASGTIGPGLENVFLRDLHSNLTYALGAVSLPGDLISPAMTPDGRYVALVGRRSSSNGSLYLFVWNTQTASVIYSNLSTAGLSSVSISPDGQRVAWWNPTLSIVDVASQANRTVPTGSLAQKGGMQFSADGNLLAYAAWPFDLNYSPNTNNVYLFNFQTGSNLLISHGYNSTIPAVGSSDSPAISADGRFIVYRSSATNLVAGVTNGQANLFVFDASTGVTSLLTQNNMQTGPADSFSLNPVFSGDGRWVIFQSWSSDLTSFGDCNANADLFAYAFPYLQITPPVSVLEGPVLTWPAVPGQTYQVQFVDSLPGGPWQNLSGTLVITGNQASLSNTPPVSSQRFYRLVIQ
jgi:Tol biopolymer transport system component